MEQKSLYLFVVNVHARPCLTHFLWNPKLIYVRLWISPGSNLIFGRMERGFANYMTLENISIDYIWSQRASASLRGRLLESTRGSRSSVPELSSVSRIYRWSNCSIRAVILFPRVTLVWFALVFYFEREKMTYGGNGAVFKRTCQWPQNILGQLWRFHRTLSYIVTRWPDQPFSQCR